MWVGMFVILIGLLLVGLSDIVIPDKDQDPAKTNTNGVIAGKASVLIDFFWELIIDGKTQLSDKDKQRFTV